MCTVRCAPGRTRTCGLVIRSDLLCPTELRRRALELVSLAPLGHQFRSTWSDSRATYVRPLDKRDVDVVCIYCPDTGSCYYVDPKQFAKSVSLRVTAPHNGQHRNVLEAGPSANCHRFRGVRARPDSR